MGKWAVRVEVSRRNSPFCPRCGETLISRVPFAVLKMKLDHGRCASCVHETPGIWRDQGQISLRPVTGFR